MRLAPLIVTPDPMCMLTENRHMDTTETTVKWASEGYTVETKTAPTHLSTQLHIHPFDARGLIVAGD